MPYIDQFSEESLLVIKKPPLAAPTIFNKQLSSSENTFLEDKFVCFAYRYQYQNGEFSAVSQFSPPAFTTSSFSFDFDSFLNEGMVNTTNAVDITINTGSSLVVAFELLFKEMTDNTIKVIEKFNKDTEGIGDNTDFVFTFDNQKIFTVLPEYEILRTYDNVPLLAQAQTIMGNRLIYGNYYEGYNLKDSFGRATNFTYNTTLLTEAVIDNSLDDKTTFSDITFTIAGTIPVTQGVMTMNFEGIDLVKGSSINIGFTLSHFAFSGSSTFPTDINSNVSVEFSYSLLQDYDTAFDLSQDADFQAKMGTSSNIQPVSTACDGTTLTDVINCALATTLSPYTKNASGITAYGQPINIFADTSSQNTIGIQPIAMKYVDSFNVIVEYYQFISSEVSYSSSTSNFSLHSNRGYEIGIIYMDEFNRSSTALVSPTNTIHVPCGNSDLINKIQVNIPGGQPGGPPAQIAPLWATRYKFCIKPDKATYETIYTSIFFKPDGAGDVYFLLEGENANKVETGDRLIVKEDAGGPKATCVFSTVLDKSTQPKNFISIDDPLNTGTDIEVPAGVYMKMKPNFALDDGDNFNNVIAQGTFTGTRGSANGCPISIYPVNIEDPATTGQFIDYDIPAGSRVKFIIKHERRGSGARCEKRTSFIETTVVASKSYTPQGTITANPLNKGAFQMFFEGENLQNALPAIAIKTPGAGEPDEVLFSYNSTVAYSAGRPILSDAGCSVTTNFFRFHNNTTNGERTFLMTGTHGCFGGNKRNRKGSHVSVTIEVIRADSGVVFETQPLEALPDVWFENDKSFAIDAKGQHTGSSQNQLIDFQNQGVVTAQDAIIDTGFANCLSFGNGVESYKVRDSIKGKEMNFGNRTFTTSAQIYKQAHRFADLTYSGVFNDETNVNKLNEFNLGLLNFKPLEDSFGPVRKLHSRLNDILALQEDRISRVLVGKDLLTDASGGGALTSVPEVLGTQIPRLEEYGISDNPESFAVWGYDVFFTDSKRAAVIKLRGDNLEVISQSGMRSWFRDFFAQSIGAQKLGGYDPYMNEFILASNTESSIDISECQPCNTSQIFQIGGSLAASANFCVNVGQDIGTVTISYVIPDSDLTPVHTEEETPTGAGDVQVVDESNSVDVVTEATLTGTAYNINAYYNGVKYTSGDVYISGTLTIPKSLIEVQDVYVEITTTSTDEAQIEMTVSCPTQTDLNVYQIGITTNNQANKTIHNEYRWTDNVFSSPIHSRQMTFAANSPTNPIVSQYSVVSGVMGTGAIPGDGALVSIISNKIPPDDFDFNRSVHKFRYLRSSTVYTNNSVDINALLAASAEATPIVKANTQYYANFTMPSGTATDNNLYLIYDYRESTSVRLCTDTTANTACCGCGGLSPTVPCGENIAVSSISSTYPAQYTITLGAATGQVTITFDAKSVLDRFIIEFDGAVVVDSQYRGATGTGVGTGTNNNLIPQLHNALLLGNSGGPYNDPITGNPYGSGSNPSTQPLPTLANGGVVANTQYPNESPGYGVLQFTKSTATTTCTLKVYSPADTGWEVYDISCPT